MVELEAGLKIGVEGVEVTKEKSVVEGEMDDGLPNLGDFLEGILGCCGSFLLGVLFLLVMLDMGSKPSSFRRASRILILSCLTFSYGDTYQGVDIFALLPDQVAGGLFVGLSALS